MKIDKDSVEYKTIYESLYIKELLLHNKPTLDLIHAKVIATMELLLHSNMVGESNVN